MSWNDLGVLHLNNEELGSLWSYSSRINFIWSNAVNSHLTVALIDLKKKYDFPNWMRLVLFSTSIRSTIIVQKKRKRKFEKFHRWLMIKIEFYIIKKNEGFVFRNFLTDVLKKRTQVYEFEWVLKFNRKIEEVHLWCLMI